MNDLQTFPKVRHIFTLYDLLGYFIPGATLLIAVGIKKFSTEILNLLIGSNVEGNLIKIIAQFKENWIVWVGISLVITYLTGHVIAALSSMLLEKLIVGKFLQYPTFNMLKTKDDSKKYQQFSHWFWFNLMLGYRGSMGTETVALFKKIFIATFSDDGERIIEKDRFNVFALCFAQIKEKCPITYERVMNYVSAYGFSRNSAMAFVIAAVLVICVFPPNYFYFVIYIIISFLLFRQYLKFLRRVNDEVFFQFIIINWPIYTRDVHKSIQVILDKNQLKF